MVFKTEQEKFWEGSFGDDYNVRNRSNNILSSNLNLFSKIFGRMDEMVDSIIEFGSNIGLNLLAIHELQPDIELSAVEINHAACDILKTTFQNNIKIYEESLLNIRLDKQRDIVLIKGVLIHINPDELYRVYSLLYNTAKKYIIIVEYYNPTPVAVTYRGNSDKLFKRDFAGEMMDTYPNLKLIDYGFIYHRDTQFPADDLTWFLLKK